MVQTASVSFPDESFWVTVGAAAPVIALAAIMSVSDMSGAWERFTESAPRYMRGWMFEAAMTHLANMDPTVREAWKASQRQAITDENQRKASDLNEALGPRVRRVKGLLSGAPSSQASTSSCSWRCWPSRLYR
jgi:hypothetical protein